MFKEVKIIEEIDLIKEADEILKKARNGYSVSCDYFGEDLIIQTLKNEWGLIKSIFVYLFKNGKWFRFKYNLKYKKSCRKINLKSFFLKYRKAARFLKPYVRNYQKLYI